MPTATAPTISAVHFANMVAFVARHTYRFSTDVENRTVTVGIECGPGHDLTTQWETASDMRELRAILGY